MNITMSTYYITQPSERQLCSNCKRSNYGILPNELCVYKKNTLERGKNTYYYHWMCISKEDFSALKKVYCHILDFVSIDKGCKRRVKQAFENDKISETEDDEPVYVKEMKRIDKEVGAMREEARIKVEKRTSSTLRTLDKEMDKRLRRNY